MKHKTRGSFVEFKLIVKIYNNKVQKLASLYRAKI
jgi:hypothetical protein